MNESLCKNIKKFDYLKYQSQISQVNDLSFFFRICWSNLTSTTGYSHITCFQIVDFSGPQYKA